MRNSGPPEPGGARQGAVESRCRRRKCSPQPERPSRRAATVTVRQLSGPTCTPVTPARSVYRWLQNVPAVPAGPELASLEEELAEAEL